MRLYKLLGVAKSASKQEIKQAYRKLALQFHPDKHTLSPKQTRDAAADKFKQMSAAYEILVDDRKRATYDRIGDATETKTPPPPRQKQHEYRRAYTYENKQYSRGGSKETRDKKQRSWPRQLLRTGLLIILWTIADVCHELIYEGQRVRLREKHEIEVEERRKSHKRELEEHRTRHEHQLEDHGTRHQRHELQVSYERELEEHRERHQDQLDKQQSRHERQCKELQERHERERQERWRSRMETLNRREE